MGGANQFRNSSSKRVNVNICRQVSIFYRNLCRYQVSYVVVLWLLSYVVDRLVIREASAKSHRPCRPTTNGGGSREFNNKKIPSFVCSGTMVIELRGGSTRHTGGFG